MDVVFWCVNKTKKVQTWSESERECGWQEAEPFISCGELSPGALDNHNQVLLVATATSSHLRDNTVSQTYRGHTDIQGLSHSQLCHSEIYDGTADRKTVYIFSFAAT